ncbi:MAG: hypothetical protein M1823_001064, partial [Watsoniomyces obsoletus]
GLNRRVFALVDLVREGEEPQLPDGELPWISEAEQMALEADVGAMTTPLLTGPPNLLKRPGKTAKSHAYYEALRRLRERVEECLVAKEEIKALHKALDFGAMHSDDDAWTPDIDVGHEAVLAAKHQSRLVDEQLRTAAATAAKAKAKAAKSKDKGKGVETRSSKLAPTTPTQPAGPDIEAILALMQSRGMVAVPKEQETEKLTSSPSTGRGKPLTGKEGMVKAAALPVVKTVSTSPGSSLQIPPFKGTPSAQGSKYSKYVTLDDISENDFGGEGDTLGAQDAEMEKQLETVRGEQTAEDDQARDSGDEVAPGDDGEDDGE